MIELSIANFSKVRDAIALRGLPLKARAKFLRDTIVEQKKLIQQRQQAQTDYRGFSLEKKAEYINKKYQRKKLFPKMFKSRNFKHNVFFGNSASLWFTGTVPGSSMSYKSVAKQHHNGRTIKNKKVFIPKNEKLIDSKQALIMFCVARKKGLSLSMSQVKSMTVYDYQTAMEKYYPYKGVLSESKLPQRQIAMLNSRLIEKRARQILLLAKNG